MGGLGTYVTCHISEFLFFLFSFFLLSLARAQVTFLDRLGRSVCQNACVQPFWGLGDIWLHLGVKLPKWAGINISQPNRQSSKIAIYRSPIKIFPSNFTDRLTTRAIHKNAKLGQRGSEGIL